MVKHLPAIQETQETEVQSLGREDPQEKEMATHSSILAWKIPWTEEPGGATPMGLQSVRYKQAHTHTNTLQTNYMSSSNSFIFSLTHHLLWKMQLLNVNSNDNFE